MAGEEAWGMASESLFTRRMNRRVPTLVDSSAPGTLRLAGYTTGLATISLLTSLVKRSGSLTAEPSATRA